MSLVPAICEQCETVFRAPIAIGGASGMALIGSRGGPCPKCGGLGIIPDGVYTSASGFIFNQHHWNLLISALGRIQQMAEAGSSSEEIQKTIDKEYPFLSYLKKLAPTNTKELTLLVGMILATLKACGPESPSPTPNVEISVRKDVLDALRDIAGKLPAAPHDNPPPQTK